MPDYDYSDNAGWSAWSGRRRIFDDVMRLAFQNPATDVADLAIDRRLWHFRWGTSQNHDSVHASGESGTTGATGSSVLQFVNVGLEPSAGTGAAYLLPPVGGSGHRYLYESDTEATPTPVPGVVLPSGVMDSVVFGAWVDYSPPESFEVLFGGHFHPDLDLVDPADAEFDSAYLALHPGEQNLLSFYLQARRPGGSEGNVYSQASVGHLANGWHHLMVHAFFKKTQSSKDVTVRWFSDGRFRHEDTFILDDDDDDWRGRSTTEKLQLVQSGMSPPALFAMSRSADPFPSGSQPHYPSPHAMDDVFLANCHPILDGADPVVDHDWQLNEPVFNIRRHPDPTLEGVESNQFILLGPVEDSGIGAGAAITKIRVHFDRPGVQTGQSVWASIRAHDNPFTPEDGLIPWTPWALLSSDAAYQDNWVTLSSEGIEGNYVQIRLRLLPSADDLNLYSPEITQVEYTAEFVALAPVSWYVPMKTIVNPYWDTPMRVLTRQDIQWDLPFRSHVVNPVPAVDVPMRINVGLRWDPVPMKTFVDPGYYWWDIPMITELVTHGQLSITGAMPMRTTVLNPDLWDSTSWNVPFQTKMNLRWAIPMETQVTADIIPMKTLVRRSLNPVDVPMRIEVVPDRPGPVSPIISNLPEAAWTGLTEATMTWQLPSYQTAYPITHYTWYLISLEQWQSFGRFASPPTQDPAFITAPPLPQTTLRSVTIPLDTEYYGSGKWVFVAYAVNTIGVGGNPSTFELWFNRPPSAPVALRVNGEDTIVRVPVVRRALPMTFSWLPASDQDGDLLTYEVEVATQPDFGISPTTLKSSVILAIASETVDFNPVEAMNPGHYWWRVRASDGNQVGSWSEIGSFYVNQPPGKPTSLAVRDAI